MSVDSYSQRSTGEVPEKQTYGIPGGFREITLGGTTNQRDWIATINAYALPDVLDVIRETASELGEWQSIENAGVVLNEQGIITQYAMGFETSFINRTSDANIINTVCVYFPIIGGHLDYSHVPLTLTNQAQGIDDTMFWSGRLIAYSRMRIAQRYYKLYGYTKLRGRATTPFNVGR